MDILRVPAKIWLRDDANMSTNYDSRLLKNPKTNWKFDASRPKKENFKKIGHHMKPFAVLISKCQNIAKDMKPRRFPNNWVGWPPSIYQKILNWQKSSKKQKLWWFQQKHQRFSKCCQCAKIWTSAKKFVCPRQKEVCLKKTNSK